MINRKPRNKTTPFVDIYYPAVPMLLQMHLAVTHLIHSLGNYYIDILNLKKFRLQQ